MKMTWCGLKITENYHVVLNKFHGNFRSRTLSFRKIKSVFRDVKWCFNASYGIKGLKRWHIGVQTNFNFKLSSISWLVLHFITYIMGLRPYMHIFFFQCGDRLETSESNIYRRQIVTSKVVPALNVFYTMIPANTMHWAKRTHISYA